MNLTVKLAVKLLKFVSTPQQALIIWAALGIVSGVALLAAIYLPGL